VVVSTARAAGFEVFGAYDDRMERRGTVVLGVPVGGPLEAAADIRDALAVVAIGDNLARRAVVDRLDLGYTPVVHPGTVVDADTEIGEGTVVFAGAVIQPRTSLGTHVIINTGATVDHDCTVGSFTHIAPGVTICGGVLLGRSVLVGAGATIVPGISVGDGAVIGAGAVVVADVAEAAVVTGVPARPTADG
jgi:sugar O-acyltransferase (sialic acid O-acetyltransferase NeuD family)